MKHSLFQCVAAFAGLVLISFIAFEGRGLGQSMGLIARTGDPVFVFTIPHPGNLARVREAIADDRILWEGDAGFALVGGRVYVRDLAEAGALIKVGGWVDKPIQIVGLGMVAGDEGGSGPRRGEASQGQQTRSERLAHLRTLVHKPSLTRAEQLFVLQAMNDGIEI